MVLVLVPGAQCMQDAAPLIGLYVPIGQTLQVTPPVTSE